MSDRPPVDALVIKGDGLLEGQRVTRYRRSIQILRLHQGVHRGKRPLSPCWSLRRKIGRCPGGGDFKSLHRQMSRGTRAPSTRMLSGGGAPAIGAEPAKTAGESEKALSRHVKDRNNKVRMNELLRSKGTVSECDRK